MKVQVLGMGCAKCKAVVEKAEQAIDDAGVEAQVEKVTDLAAIAEYGVMVTPALAVDGEVKVAGRVPSVDEIKGWLTGGHEGER
jgi:small redox-active disulfide protein 2